MYFAVLPGLRGSVGPGGLPGGVRNPKGPQCMQGSTTSLMQEPPAAAWQPPSTYVFPRALPAPSP